MKPSSVRSAVVFALLSAAPSALAQTAPAIDADTRAAIARVMASPNSDPAAIGGPTQLTQAQAQAAAMADAARNEEQQAVSQQAAHDALLAAGRASARDMRRRMGE